MLRSIPPITSCGINRKINEKNNIIWKQPYRKSYNKIHKTAFFKKIKEPIIDIFNETNIIKIITDLGSFSKDEIDINIKPNKYIIFAKCNEQEFKKEITLIPNIDIKKITEHFKNGILETIIPKIKKK